ncbi:expressed unknown protein [Seminavis robusta]|uniref:Uncharacterized protein n=1 Tax=Seminavis robusta TaxID=568900 RepID=A0A9N8ETP2_9STRA|nr:expressed unknown protein [Seminavis robusta]|eukprot:Sro1734_g294300.1 n/a (121) ;mRNA; r:10341-10863
MAEAINFARRLSSRNEPDLLQEDFAGPEPKSTFTQQYCSNLVKNVCPSSPLPTQCKKYPEVLMSLQKRNSDRHAQSIAFAGMSPGETSAAMVARDKGRLSQAQIKRRLTTPDARHNSWWA